MNRIELDTGRDPAGMPRGMPLGPAIPSGAYRVNGHLPDDVKQALRDLAL